MCGSLLSGNKFLESFPKLMLCHLPYKEYLESSTDPTKPQQSHLYLMSMSRYASHSMLLYVYMPKAVMVQNSILVTLGTETDLREPCYTIIGNYCFEASLTLLKSTFSLEHKTIYYEECFCPVVSTELD